MDPKIDAHIDDHEHMRVLVAGVAALTDVPMAGTGACMRMLMCCYC